MSWVDAAELAGLFGFDPTFRDPVGVPLPSSIEMPGIGSLANINVPEAAAHV